ncbi:MAG: hypothetical protein ACK2VA_01325 [Anaerolineae bacterium]|jgi:hypothetical protein
MRKGIVALSAVVMLVLVLVVPASATQSTHVSGDWPDYGLIGGPPSFTERGKTCYIEGDFWYGWGGDITGRSDAHLDIVSHGPCFDESGALYPKASFREGLKVTGIFEGCVLDRCGTFEYRELMTFTPVEGGPADTPNYDLVGRIIIQHGTGGLAGLHGVLTEEGSSRDGVEAGGYEGEIHFDPK